jgi:hypothetical protein
VLAVAFPADPCLGQDSTQPCGSKAEPRANGISFVFTGSSIRPGAGLTFEIDWIALEPKDQPGLAWRPVLLAHGWRGKTFTWTDEGWAWGPGLRKRDIGFHAVELDRYGTILDNGPKITAAVADLKDRFGVERVNVVGYCKGGLDAREHVHQHNDVDTLIMLATPNLGSFEIDAIPPEALKRLIPTAEADPKQVARSARDLTSSRLLGYNRRCQENPRTVYVAAAVAHTSPIAASKQEARGENDEFVSVRSVHTLPYAAPEKYETSTDKPENQKCCHRAAGWSWRRRSTRTRAWSVTR